MEFEVKGLAVEILINFKRFIALVALALFLSTAGCASTKDSVGGQPSWMPSSSGVSSAGSGGG